MMYLGDFPVGGKVEFDWNTNAVAGESITRGTNGSIRVYKGSSATERSSSNGITDIEDFDGLTGVHHCTIDLSDNTDAGFYAAGNEYQVVLVGAEIDGKTVNAVLAHFAIERAGGVLAMLKNGSYGLAALEAALAAIDSAIDDVPGLVWDEDPTDHDAPETFGEWYQSKRRDTAQAGGASTITLDSGASSTDDFYINDVIYIVSGTGAGQARIITDYDGTSKQATVNTPWAIQPDNSSVFQIVPDGSSGASSGGGGGDCPSASDIADAVWDEALSGHGSAGTAGKVVADIAAAVASVISDLATMDGKIDTIDSVVDAILVDTGTDIPSTLSTIAGYVDTEIASIISKLGDIETDTQDIQGRLPAALTANGHMKADILAIDGATGAATRLKKGVQLEVAGVCDSGGTTTSIVASSLDPDSDDDDQFIGRVIIFDADTTTAGLRAQATVITDYDDSSKTFTVDALTRAPASGDTFRIV